MVKIPKINFLQGTVGSGKTAHLIIDALIAVSLPRPYKKHFVTNIKSVKWIPHTKVEIEDLIEMCTKVNQLGEPDLSEYGEDFFAEPKFLGLDEIHTMFDGRRSGTSMNIEFSYFISQSRKFRCDIDYTSQYPAGGDIRLRQITRKYIECIPHYNGYEEEPTFIEYQVFDIQSKRFHTWCLPRTLLRDFYKYYNTYEVIVPTSARGDR